MSRLPWAVHHLCALGLTRSRRRKGRSFPADALDGPAADAKFASNLQDAFAGPQMRLDAFSGELSRDAATFESQDGRKSALDLVTLSRASLWALGILAKRCCALT